jgi:hypothetical protein
MSVFWIQQRNVTFLMEKNPNVSLRTNSGVISYAGQGRGLEVRKQNKINTEFTKFLNS